MTVKAPTTLEEYEARYERNHRQNGDGTHDLPCPFCAAPGWLENADTSQTSMPVLCLACGRSARFVHVERGRSQVPEVELVQVAGADPPAYLDPPPRRVEERDSIDPLAHRGRVPGRGQLPKPVEGVRGLRKPKGRAPRRAV